MDANLRAGPSVASDVLGGTVAGQPLTIVGRTEAGDWFLLDNGGWIFANLVANAPALDDVPVTDGTDAAAPTAGTVTTTTVTTATDTITTTAPSTATAPTAAAQPSLTADEIDYVDTVNSIQRSFSDAFSRIERLISELGEDPTLVDDGDWSLELSTTIAILRISARQIDRLEPPARFAEANASLVEAAASYRAAADLIGQGVVSLDTDVLANAIEQIQAGTVAFDSAQAAILAVLP